MVGTSWALEDEEEDEEEDDEDDAEEPTLAETAAPGRIALNRSSLYSSAIVG
jgi:hypothetical protein